MVRKLGWTKPVFLAAVMVILPLRAAKAQVASPSTGPAAPSVASPSTAPAPTTPLEILQSGATQESRDVAARKLVASHEDAIRPDLVQILRTNRGGQLAIARALGAIPWPHNDFIEPLFAMLEGGTSLRYSAAAKALAQYRGNSDVLSRLMKIADSSQPDDVRVPVIRAIGRFDQKAAAQTLIDLQQRGANDAIVLATGDALIDMTGLADNGRDVAKWKSWWDRVGRQSETAFHEEIARSRAENFQSLVARQRQMEEGVASLLQDLYRQAADADQRSKILLRYMQSPIAAIRVVAANQVAESRDTPLGAPPDTMREVRTLLDDVSAEVRAAAAGALYNDQDSASAMIDQLSRETDEQTRTALMHSLAPLHDPRAIELAVKFLQNGASLHVQLEAADAIRQAAGIINMHPELRAHVLAALVPLARQAAAPDREVLRVRAIDALAMLADPGLRTIFQDLVRPAEPTDVRVAAMRGLGNLKDPNLGDQIAGYMTDNNAQIRVAAIDAMGSVPHPLYIQQLLDRMNDPSDAAKAAAWQVLQTWMPDISEQYLAVLADGLKALGDLPRQLIVRIELRDRLQKDVTAATTDAQRSQNMQDRAAQEQVIGEIMERLQRPADAADHYKAALDYWRAHNGDLGVLDPLSGAVVRSLLQARKWPEATKFAEGFVGQTPPDPTEETISKEFKIAADNLLKSNNPRAYDDAAELFKAVDAMKPPLKQTYRDQLQEVQKQIQQNRSGQPPMIAP